MKKIAAAATIALALVTQAAPPQGGRIAISKEATEALREKRKAFAKAQMEWEVEKVQIASGYIGFDNKIWANSQYDESMTHIVPRYKSTEPEDVSLRIGK